MQIRRVVSIKNRDGKSVVASDGPSPSARALRHTPGFVSTPLWFTGASAQLTSDQSDAAVGFETLLPHAHRTGAGARGFGSHSACTCTLL
jgi:hypothetical protein